MRNVYVVDDDDIASDWLNETISLLPNVSVARLPSGDALLKELPRLGEGVVLMDLKMPGLSGMETLERYRDALDRFPTIMMSAVGDIADAVKAMRLGAIDFLEKPCTPRTLFEKLKLGFEAVDDHLRTSSVQAEAQARFAALSDREVEVLRHLIDGKVNREIAEVLDLSVRTVEVYRAKLMMKLGVNSLADAIRLAFASGFVSTEAA